MGRELVPTQIERCESLLVYGSRRHVFCFVFLHSPAYNNSSQGRNLHWRQPAHAPLNRSFTIVSNVAVYALDSFLEKPQLRFSR